MEEGVRQDNIGSDRLLAVTAIALGFGAVAAFRIDHDVMARIAEHSPGFADLLFGAITYLGHGLFLASVFLALFVFLAEERPFLSGILALTVAGLFTHSVKLATLRLRPDGKDGSFPSGHSAAAFAGAALLAQRFPRFTYVFYAGASGVALSRVYLQRHFPSDVLMGAAIGLVAGLAGRAVARRLPARRGRRMPRIVAVIALVLAAAYAGRQLTRKGSEPLPPHRRPTAIIDDGDSGYTEMGDGWAGEGAGGYLGGYRCRRGGTPPHSARWTFLDLEARSYEVFATWTAFPDHTGDAEYVIYGDDRKLSSVRVDQRASPGDQRQAGVLWKTLGRFEITGGSLAVELRGAAEGVLVADAVKIDRADNKVIDNGDWGYRETGARWNWGSLDGAYNSNYRYHPPGSGTDAALWRFSGLLPGRYKVYTTWTPAFNRARAAPYAVFDGERKLATVLVDQEQPPADQEALGVWWDELGTFEIGEGSLTVSLSDDADGFVIADAVRLAAVE